MSFRSDDQRRYGHVPPVQYPVSQPQDGTSYPARRPSFNSGDDASYFNQPQAHSHPYANTSASAGTEDELFLTSPTSSVHRPTYTGSTDNALSAHQHQYQGQGQAPPTPTHATYNPQHFARPQSTSLPYHPPPPQRYSSTSSSISHAPTSPTTYTPAQYNPAAYAAASQPHRQSTLHGHNYGHGYGSPPVPQHSPAFSPSPSSPYASAFPQSAQVHQDSALPSRGHGSAASRASSYDPSYQPSYANTYATYPNGDASSPVPTPAPYTTAASSAPYPMQSQIPVGPQYAADPAPSVYNGASRSNSLNSQASSAHVHSPGVQRHPTNAPLPSRPMDNVPEEPGWDTNYARHGNDHARLQDDIIQDIEAELAARTGRNRSTSVNGAPVSDDELHRRRRYTTTTLDSSNVSRYSSNASTNPQRTHTSSTSTFYYDEEEEEEEEDDDPEGTAGVLAMRQAEMDDQRFGSTATLSYTDLTAARTLPPPPEEQSSDNDYRETDLGLFSGGYEAPSGTLAYGNDVGSPPMDQAENTPRPLPARPGHQSSTSHESHEAAPAFREAEVDYGGTGGLQPPTAHRLSFDEGEERVSVHSPQSGSESPQKEDYPDIFYHPGMSNRPLPPFPQAPRSESGSTLSVQVPGQPSRQYSHGHSLSVDSRYMNPTEDPEGYYTSPGAGYVPPERSISLSSHSNTPQVQAPARSRTDAAEERRKLYRQQQQQHPHHHMSASHMSPYEGYETDAQSSMAYDLITLPSGRRRKFVPSKLTSADFRKCTEPWALSGIAAWVREMADGEPDLKQKTVEEALVNLFTHRVPTLNVADAEVLSTRVVGLMLDAQILLPEEEWVKFGPGSISGVLWQLTGSGCYAPKLHQPDGPGRCYSHHCMRTLKKANLDELMLEEVKAEDWATFYKVTKESIGGKSKKEIERQNVLHEIVTSEEGYMNQLEVLRVLYRDQIRNAPSPIIAPNRVEKFVSVVFGKVDAVQATNKEHLLAQLKYRQQEQGPWITGFSDLFREWIRKARDVYIDYASQYPHASYLVRKEADRNIIFQEFLDRVRSHKRSTRLDWTHFLKAPITRLQRYTFLLQTVEKNMLQDSEEKANLARAISEIHNVTLECDQKVAEMQKKVEMMELNAMLVLRPGFHSVLNLDHLGRELILQGELQRMGSKGVRWVDTHALLFDHYLILSKPVSAKDGKSGKKFDVSKEVGFFSFFLSLLWSFLFPRR